MDQGSKRREHNVVRLVCAVLWVYGFCMGWICLHYELATAACVRADLHGTVQSEAVCELYDVVCAGHACEHAGPIRGISADSE